MMLQYLDTLDESLFDPGFSPYGPLPEVPEPWVYFTAHNQLATMCAVPQVSRNALCILCSIPPSSLVYVARIVLQRSMEDPADAPALEVVADAMRRRGVSRKARKAILQ
jgi:hypothetical protein